jgi:hypothetical protein
LQRDPLSDGTWGGSADFEFPPDWVAMSGEAVTQMENLVSEAGEAERLRWLEKSAIRLSLRNLKAFRGWPSV